MDGDWEKKLKMRTPNTAIEMIISYIVERFDLAKYQYKLVAVEQPFLGEQVFIVLGGIERHLHDAVDVAVDRSNGADVHAEAASDG